MPNPILIAAGVAGVLLATPAVAAAEPSVVPHINAFVPVKPSEYSAPGLRSPCPTA